MTPAEFTAFFLTASIAIIGVTFALGWLACLSVVEKRAAPRTWEKKPETNPYTDHYPPGTRLDEIFPDLADDEWQRWMALAVAETPERLADTGELARLYEQPYPPARLASTGELRALALAGNADEIAAQNEAYKKGLDQ